MVAPCGSRVMLVGEVENPAARSERKGMLLPVMCPLQILCPVQVLSLISCIYMS